MAEVSASWMGVFARVAGVEGGWENEILQLLSKVLESQNGLHTKHSPFFCKWTCLTEFSLCRAALFKVQLTLLLA